MLALASKPLDAITAADIELLCREQPQEGSQIEFKERLPTRDGKQDPWETGAAQISDRARNELLAEIVAFANAHGGHLLVGVKESEDKPSRAMSIVPVPRCAELAEKLRLQARDCIEPELPILSTAGVVTDGAGGGIVIVRVDPSRLAPHRLRQTLECYYRRADRTERMTMREIQDLTLARERGLARVDAMFEARAERFRTWCGEMDKPAFGFRVTLVPMSQDVHVKNIHQNPAAFPPMQNFRARFKEDDDKSRFDLYASHSGWDPRPILRGSRRQTLSAESRSMQEAVSDGVLDFLACYGEAQLKGQPQVYIGSLLAFVANGLAGADAMRRHAGLPDAEYGMEIELLPFVAGIKLLWVFDHWMHGGMGVLEPVVLPRLSVGSVADFNSIMTVVMNDLRNHVGTQSLDAIVRVEW